MLTLKLEFVHTIFSFQLLAELLMAGFNEIVKFS